MRRVSSIALSAAALLASSAQAAPQAGSISNAFSSLSDQITFGIPANNHIDVDAAKAAGVSTLEAIADKLRDVAESFVSSSASASSRWAKEAQKDAAKLLDEMETLADATMQGLAYGRKEISQSAKAVVGKVPVVADQAIEYQLVSSPLFPQHKMRVRSPKALCDPKVKQYSGYLDVSETKHLFFWFFESRNDPDNSPVVQWNNGGPGCASSTGLLMELGPCNANNLSETDYNKSGWNSNSNIFFLDQPVAVGYSYSDSPSGDKVVSSEEAAADVYAFLQLFYQQFPKYKKLPLHLAAESYGGHYAPAFAHRIYKENLALASGLFDSSAVKPFHIPLESVMIGNGLTDPLVQFAQVPEYGCAPSDYAVFDETTCESLRSKVPTCQRLQKYCYDSPSRFTCVPATFYCWSAMYGPFQNLGLNPYNVKEKCDRNKNPLCYEEMNWIEGYLNKPEVKKELGVPSEIEFQSCNMEVNRAFQVSGDNMHNSAALLPELLEAGVRLLVYAGELDFMCNYLGNEAWMLELDTPFTAEFGNSSSPYMSTFSKKAAGTVRSAGPGAGNYTYVSLLNSGHMVPHDQPEISLELLNRWLANKPLISA